MAKYLMLALNGPTGGAADEETLNRWYEEVHLPAFRAIKEVKSARRYKVLRGKLPGMEHWPYIAAYEIETDDYAAVSAQLGAKMQDFSPALDRDHSAHLLAICVAGDA